MTLRSRPGGVQVQIPDTGIRHWHPGAGRRTCALRPVSCRPVLRSPGHRSPGSFSYSGAPRSTSRPSTLSEPEIVEGRRPALLVQRPGNAGQAPHRIGGQQSVIGGMGQHFGPFSVAMAAAANVGVLEGGGFSEPVRKARSRSVRMRGRSSGSNGSRWPPAKTSAPRGHAEPKSNRAGEDIAIGRRRRQIGPVQPGKQIGPAGAMAAHQAHVHRVQAPPERHVQRRQSDEPMVAPPRPRCRGRVCDRDIQRCVT